MTTKFLEIFKNSNLKIINEDKLIEYINFCIDKNQKEKIKFKTDHHHILPKNEDCFPEYINLNIHPWNGAHLLYKDHKTAHKLFVEAVDVKSQVIAFAMMKTDDYNIIKERHYRYMSDLMSTKSQEIADNLYKDIKNGLNGHQRKALKGAKTRIENGNGSEISNKAFETMMNTVGEDGLTIAERRSIKSANSKRGKKLIERTCPHCGKTGRGGNMKRYHFENCKPKEEEW